jgi:hypothetical protein
MALFEYAEPVMMFRGTAVAKWQDNAVLFEDICLAMTEKDLKDLGLDKTWVT